MLSCILNSKTAIEVNIKIIRVFVKMREYALTHKDILLQLANLEKEVKGNSKDIENIFTVLKELIEKGVMDKIDAVFLLDTFWKLLYDKLCHVCINRNRLCWQAICEG
jgi:hypothetical protein